MDTVIAFNPNPIGRYACIYNNNGQRVVSSGDIVGETQYAHSEFILNIPLNPGASGTGVFAMDGHCIGIMIYHQKKIWACSPIHTIHTTAAITSTYWHSGRYRGTPIFNAKHWHWGILKWATHTRPWGI